MAETCPQPGSNPQAGVSRREFVKTVGAAAAVAAVPFIGARHVLAAAAQTGPTPSAPAETAVARFFKTLKDDQRKQICFPFDHPLRSRVQNNWAIVKPTIADMSKEQQALCKEIFKNLCSEEGYERFQRQMEEDYGGFDNYHVAVFGEPGTDQPFEWVLTGRHNTMRADGNSVEGVAFGGPIFYGHASRQLQRGRQAHRQRLVVSGPAGQQDLQDARRQAAGQGPRREGRPGRSPLDRAEGPGARRAGHRRLRARRPAEGDGSEAARRHALARSARCDAAEVRECLDEAGGIDKLRLTYFKEGDIGDDGTWDMWKVEGPAFSWYFHGSPHVHTWLNVARKA